MVSNSVTPTNIRIVEKRNPELGINDWNGIDIFPFEDTDELFINIQNVDYPNPYIDLIGIKFLHLEDALKFRQALDVAIRILEIGYDD